MKSLTNKNIYNRYNLIVLTIPETFIDDQYYLLALKDLKKDNLIDFFTKKEFMIENNYLKIDWQKRTGLKVTKQENFYDCLENAYKKNNISLLFLDLDEKVYYLNVPWLYFPSFSLSIVRIDDKNNKNKNNEIIYSLDIEYNDENKIFDGFRKAEQDLIKYIVN